MQTHVILEFSPTPLQNTSKMELIPRKDYLRQLRICHAQYLLQHTELMVSEVAMRCGFEDSNYFSVVFNREVGMTPVQWRHRSRKAA